MRFDWEGKELSKKIAQIPSFGQLVSCKEESMNFNETKNLYIEGDNLEVLKLLQKEYSNKIKMIYIDPPYNTGKDFIYRDSFNQNIEDYIRKTGQANLKTKSQYHSEWLNMMYSRLKVARNLLKDDGVIFVSIDDNEVHNLRHICDEIFGEENFVGTFKWNKTSTAPSLSKKIRQKYEFVICYEKQNDGKVFNGGKTDGGDMPLLNEGNNITILEFPSDKVFFKFNGNYKKGRYDRIKLLSDIKIINGHVEAKNFKLKGPFKWQQSNLENEIKNNTTFVVKSEKFAIRYIRQGERMKTPSDIISKEECDVGTNENANKEIINLFKVKDLFKYSKPTSLIKYLSKFLTNADDIILDFFSGSATTAHAIMELNAEDRGNRQFIMVQLPEKTDEKSEAYKTGYKTIAEIGKERIRRAGKKIIRDSKIKNLDIGFKVLKLEYFKKKLDK